LRAEVERLRGVVEAARKVRDHERGDLGGFEESPCEDCIHNAEALDRALAELEGKG